MYCDTAQAKAGNVTYLWSCLSSLGPRANSISDLWWMVWQEGVAQIVMLTNIQEGGRVGSWAYCLCPCFCTVQFCSVQFKMVSIRWGKNAYTFHPGSQRFPQRTWEKVPMFVGLTMALSCTSFQGRSSSASSFWAYLSSRRSIAWCPWVLWREVLSQAPQHLRSSET